MIPSSSQPGACPDCGAPLLSIKLFGRGPESLAGFALESDVTFYTAADADRDTWSGKYKVDGAVQAYICTSCRRIFLYGAPAQEK
jgi:hypothetical protein